MPLKKGSSHKTVSWNIRNGNEGGQAAKTSSCNRIEKSRQRKVKTLENGSTRRSCMQFWLGLLADRHGSASLKGAVSDILLHADGTEASPGRLKMCRDPEYLLAAPRAYWKGFLKLSLIHMPRRIVSSLSCKPRRPVSTKIKRKTVSVSANRWLMRRRAGS